MNYTPNHHLPQWVKSDRIRMEDFNSAMSSIDSGITSADAKAASAQSAASSAQSTALSALDKVNSVLSADNLPFAVGSYTGLGEDPVHVGVGFRPSFLIVSGMRGSTDANSLDEFVRYFAITSDSENVRTRIQLTSLGFTAYRLGNNNSFYPNLNEAGRHYDYIAFR